MFGEEVVKKIAAYAARTQAKMEVRVSRPSSTDSLPLPPSAHIDTRSQSLVSTKRIRL